MFNNTNCDDCVYLIAMKPISKLILSRESAAYSTLRSDADDRTNSAQHVVQMLTLMFFFRLSRRETAISWGAACFLQLNWLTGALSPPATCLGSPWRLTLTFHKHLKNCERDLIRMLHILSYFSWMMRYKKHLNAYLYNSSRKRV